GPARLGRPDDRLREAIHLSASGAMDCFVAPLLAMTNPPSGPRVILTPASNCKAIRIYEAGGLSMEQATLSESIGKPTAWLHGRSFESWREEFDTRGFLIFERVLPSEVVAAIRAALAPHLARDLKGRNDFEGLSTNRVYALLAKSPVFAELV